MNIVVNALDAHMGMGGPDDNAAQANHLVTHALRADGFDAGEDGTGRGTPLVVQPIAFSNVSDGSSARNADDIADPITCRHGDPGMVAYQCKAVAIAIQEVGKRTGASTTDVRAGIGIAADGDLMFTLQSGAQHGVACQTIPIDMRQASRGATMTNNRAESACSGGAPGMGIRKASGHTTTRHVLERGRHREPRRNIRRRQVPSRRHLFHPTNGIFAEVHFRDDVKKRNLHSPVVAGIVDHCFGAKVGELRADDAAAAGRIDRVAEWLCDDDLINDIVFAPISPESPGGRDASLRRRELSQISQSLSSR